MIKYKNISLFDAPKGSLIVHSANSQGVWGSGIAKDIAQRYPNQYAHYRNNAHRIGEAVFELFYNIEKDGDHHVINLITSSLESKNPDKEEDILINTTTALFDFITFYKYHMDQVPIYSNKFNSGLFNVPWEKTEKILATLVDRYNIDWTVCNGYETERNGK